MKRTILAFAVIACLTVNVNVPARELPLENLVMPEGFSVAIFAHVKNPRQLAQGADGSIYVGTRKEGKVYAIRPATGDGKEPRLVTLDKQLPMPSGVSIRGDDLYVAATNQILKYADVTHNDKPTAELITDELPDKQHHGWKFIGFGPDGHLYVPVGAPCNICLPDAPIFATILQLDLAMSHPEPVVFASGIRNSVGFDWHPVTKELWFTDNGRDYLGDDIPPDELNRASRAGLHFGFPYFHGPGIRDPEYGKAIKAEDFVEPEQNLGPHVAPLGMTFYTGTAFPERFHNQIIIPEHGSWNRSRQAGHTGYRLTLVSLKNSRVTGYEVFVEGWLRDNKAWGRPVAALVLADGSLLVSDDMADVIYRFSYRSN